MAIQPIYNESGHSGYGGNPIGMYSPTTAPMQTQGQSKGFWEDWASSIEKGGGVQGSGGLGSQVGGAAGGALGTAIGGPAGGMIGSQLGTIAGDALEGGLMGGDESGADKLADEQKQSEQITRSWEIKNAVPTAGVGQVHGKSIGIAGVCLYWVCLTTLISYITKYFLILISICRGSPEKARRGGNANGYRQYVNATTEKLYKAVRGSFRVRAETASDMPNRVQI